MAKQRAKARADLRAEESADNRNDEDIINKAANHARINSAKKNMIPPSKP